MTKKNKNNKNSFRLKKRLRQNIRLIFDNAGFTLVPQQDIDIKLNGQQSDLDNIFIFENIIVIAEDTTSATNPGDHLRKKAEFFKHCQDNKSELINFLKKLPAYKNSKAIEYGDSDINLFFIYATSSEFDITYKKRYPHLKFIDKKILSYFISLSKVIKKSTKFEIFKFLGIDFDEIGTQTSSTPYNEYTGLILPETPSGFDNGYKLVSLLIDPSTLLKQSYVLRKDGWMDNDCVYQRILIGSKISSMRKYLSKEGRVYVNNVIVTLPDDIAVTDTNNKNLLTQPVATNAIKHPVQIKIPRKMGNIGIIDGQHRVFSYHEGNDTFEKIICNMRDKQHLLITGIIFPKNLSKDEREKFEAKLFLEINDKQTRANPALRQVIGMIINPFEDVSIARKVVSKLAELSPMNEVLEQHFFDRGKLKTTSIVSYGVRHITKLSGNDSLFFVWSNKKKSSILKGKNRKLLQEYVDFCTKEINAFLQAFKKNVPVNMWTTNRKTSRVLSATTIIGLIYCLKLIIENKKKMGNFDYYDKGFKKLGAKIDFTPKKFKFKSSHWSDLGDEIYEYCFK